MKSRPQVQLWPSVLFSLYQRATPTLVRKWFSPVISSAETLRQFLTYGTIGASCSILDFSLLALLLKIGLFRPLAVTISFVTLSGVSFLLNKRVNFSSSQRSTVHQARTYLVLAVILWLSTVVWIEAAVRISGVNPLLAKLAIMPLTATIGFVSVRHLAFGNGVREMLSAMRAKD